MNIIAHIEASLHSAVAAGEIRGCPPKLAGAIRHAVFPAGARIRPQLCMAVAKACGLDDPGLATAAAISIEFLHCASLVHDDLPCFDDAPTRRGQPSVHSAYGQSLAVLAGDALIVLAFQSLARAAHTSPARLPGLLDTIASGVGMPFGIVAGQAWESEPKVSLTDYQRAKTGALFVAATAAGAQAAGADPLPWRALGDWLGEAYQVADDIRDVMADPQLLGKPTGQDISLGRPSSAIDLGLAGAIEHFESLVDAASKSVPDGPSAEALRKLVRLESERLVPRAACEQFRKAHTRTPATPSKPVTA